MFIKNNKLPQKLILAIELTIFLAIFNLIDQLLELAVGLYGSSGYATGRLYGAIFVCFFLLAFARELYLARKPWVRRVYIGYACLGIVGLFTDLSGLSDLDKIELVLKLFSLLRDVIFVVIIYLLLAKEVAQLFLLNKLQRKKDRNE